MNQDSIVARYGDDGSVELAGSPTALTSLASLLRSPGAASVELPVPSNDPRPYAGYVRQLVIRPSDTNVLVTRLAEELVVSGNSRARGVLADNIEQLAGDPGQSGEHLHIEPYPGHSYLMQGSVPLVVSITEPGLRHLN